MTIKSLFRNGLRLDVLAAITTLLASSLCLPAAAQMSATLPGRWVVDLPYKPLNIDANLQIVDVTINKTYHTHFLFDTGSNVPLIASDTVASLHIPTMPKEAPVGIMDGKPEMIAPLFLTVPNMTGKPAMGFQIEPIIVKQSHLTMLGPDIEGVLGANALKTMAVGFDFQKHIITILLGGNLTPTELSTLGFQNATVLPLVLSNGLYRVQVRLSNGPRQTREELVVDTGSDLTFFSSTSAKALGGQARGDYHGQSFDPRGDQATEAQATLGLGNITFANQAFKFYDNEKASGPAVLGLDILMRYRVLMDLPAGKMYLVPVTPPGATVRIKEQSPAPTVQP